MAVEYRERTMKQYRVKLISTTVKTNGSEICVRFRTLLNRENHNFTMIASVVHLFQKETVIYERFVPDSSSTFVSRWEDVQLNVNVTMNSTILLLFEVIIPPGSQGFYATVDDVNVPSGRCNISIPGM